MSKVQRRWAPCVLELPLLPSLPSALPEGLVTSICVAWLSSDDLCTQGLRGHGLDQLRATEEAGASEGCPGLRRHAPLGAGLLQEGGHVPCCTWALGTHLEGLISGLEVGEGSLGRPGLGSSFCPLRFKAKETLCLFSPATWGPYSPGSRSVLAGVSACS